ncbi:AI-2E family transporter [Segetibacter sp. 3557_3]|uniref:AI-2E family transporter n=1 Tax=Segetibacter sp. 3557_3 TaxID=2547429 RepID=UPI0010591EBD|nr:AI-2E family transporter [Segetibacter sp. 3557_3]TDH25142.1 AI-2E family transporter [Segetibacter sp. 3557_3]
MNVSKQPFLVRFSLVLFCLIAFSFIVYIGQDVIVPFAFAGLLAVLLLPFNRMLEKKGLGRVPATLISLTIFFIALIIVVYFLFTQIASFLDDFPTIERKLQHHANTAQRWISQNMHLSKKDQNEVIKESTEQIKEANGGGGLIGQTFLSVTEFLLVIVLLPIYSFLILYYRDMIRQFLIELFQDGHQQKVIEVIKESRVVVYNYMLGLSIEMAIITVINTVGFLLVGIKYAFFLGLLAAILNLIPYVGMLIASIFCALVTLTTSNNLSDIIWVLVVLTVVQFFDNNIIMPKIVGSKVKINALVTIIGVIVGGALCGFSGMFLSIPLIAILKVIFDRIDDMKPWGKMMGDEITYLNRGKLYRHYTEMRKKRREPGNEPRIIPQPEQHNLN